MQGLAYVHVEGIIHRDIKPQNIMLEYKKEGEYPIKIVDFGLSTIYGNPSQSLCGTPYFMAPEVWKFGTYSNKVDIWGCGILLYMLLNGTPPFTGLTNINELKNEIRKGKIYEQLIENLPYISPYGEDILNLMLQDDAELRPSAQMLLKHKWFSSDLIQEIPLDIQKSIINNMKIFKVLDSCRIKTLLQSQ